MSRRILSPDRFGSREEWEISVWKKLIEELAEASSAKEIEKLLAPLLTAYEKKQIVKRTAAIFFTQRGMGFREIERTLWLSPTTINAIKKSIRETGQYTSHYSRKKKKK